VPKKLKNIKDSSWKSKRWHCRLHQVKAPKKEKKKKKENLKKIQHLEVKVTKFSTIALGQ
jgi:hypothetical protein